MLHAFQAEIHVRGILIPLRDLDAEEALLYQSFSIAQQKQLARFLTREDEPREDGQA